MFVPMLFAAILGANTLYEIRLDEAAGHRVIAIAAETGGGVTMATGGEQLSLMSRTRAEAAYAKLLAQERKSPCAPVETDKRPITHTLDIETPPATMAGAQAGKDPAPSNDANFDTLFDTDLGVADAGPAQSPQSGGRRATIRVYGASAGDAVKFIDGIDGLGELEKAQMKSALGL